MTPKATTENAESAENVNLFSVSLCLCGSFSVVLGGLGGNHSVKRYFSSTHSATTPSRHVIFLPSS